MVIDGRAIAQKIVDELKTKNKPNKSLVVILVGDNKASISFLKQKEKLAKNLGINFQLKQFSDINEEYLINEIEKLNSDNAVGGIIVQLPLPEEINKNKILSKINIKKDVDALAGQEFVLPLSVEVVGDILRIMNYELRIKTVVVVGAEGFLVGRPISRWLEGKCEKLIKLDLGDDLSQIKEADLVISGVGKSGLIRPDMLKEGVGVIDFGYDMKDGKLSGDFDSDNLQPKIWYTPTPGGTGPILVAEIFKNFYKLSKIIKK